MEPSFIDNTSDDEIFIGPLTMKEVKKRIFMDKQYRQTISCVNHLKQEDGDECVTIIESHSEPDIVGLDDSNLSNDLKSISSPEINNSKSQKRISSDKSLDDTFMKLEKMVTELSILPMENSNPPLDNTLDVVNFVLNNGPTVQGSNQFDNHELILENTLSDTNTQMLNEDLVTIPLFKIEAKCDLIEPKKDNASSIEIKHTDVEVKEEIKCEIDSLINTPINRKLLNKTDQHGHIFETPKNLPLCQKKSVLSVKKTPYRSNAFQHIMSPIASYIKNCPQTPLLKDVHPKKPLPGTTYIPKLVKSCTQSKALNKENVQFPSIAYKSAKKTLVVSEPNQDKMPQGDKMNKLTSSLKKPTVIKHNHRLVNNCLSNLNKKQEDSFVNLPLQQADLSVCTKKSAFSKIKNNI